MKKFCYSIIGLFVIVLVSSCSNGSKVLQSPEDAVRERYGLPWQTEEEYEAACKSNRKFQGATDGRRNLPFLLVSAAGSCCVHPHHTAYLLLMKPLVHSNQCRL